MKATKIKNLVNTLSPLLQDRVRYFSITEVFVIDGDLGITSTYNIPNEVVNLIKAELCLK